MAKKKKIKLINPKREPLTVEKLRELSGLNLSDEEAEEMVESIHKLALILHRFVTQYNLMDKNANDIS